MSNVAKNRLSSHSHLLLFPGPYPRRTKRFYLPPSSVKLQRYSLSTLTQGPLPRNPRPDHSISGNKQTPQNSESNLILQVRKTKLGENTCPELPALGQVSGRGHQRLVPGTAPRPPEQQRSSAPRAGCGMKNEPASLDIE